MTGASRPRGRTVKVGSWVTPQSRNLLVLPGLAGLDAMDHPTEGRKQKVIGIVGGVAAQCQRLQTSGESDHGGPFMV
ncbi:hypothetical protein B7463_g4662, partial [Scytalidium lignicola]